MKRLSLTSSIALGLALALGGCATQNKTQLDQSGTSHEASAPDRALEYEKLIESYSDGESKYSGFHNNFEYKATLLNSAVRAAILGKKTHYYLWAPEKAQAEREKDEKEMAAQTDVYVSFFTPDRKNDNLADDKAIWRVYLEAGGSRYQGKVKRVKMLLAELQTLYPYHTRWTTPYEITFPVPTHAIETQSSVLTITGPLGTRTVQFRSVR